MIDLVSSWLFQAIDSFVKWNPKVFLLRNHASEKMGQRGRSEGVFHVNLLIVLAPGSGSRRTERFVDLGASSLENSYLKPDICRFLTNRQIRLSQNHSKSILSKKQNTVPVRRISGLHLLVEAHVVLHQLVYCDPRAARWSVTNRDGWETSHFQMNGHRYSYGIHVYLFSYLFIRFCDWKWVSGIWFL